MSKTIIAIIIIIIVAGLGCWIYQSTLAPEKEEEGGVALEKLEGKDIEQIPESELREICVKKSWPPGGCSVIADTKGRRLCEKCEELIGIEIQEQAEKEAIEEGIVKEEDITQITFFKGENINTAFDPDWSPDGSQIVFGRMDKGELGELYIINSDGTGLFKIGSPGIYSPAWSPVDNRILCNGWEEGENSALYMIDLDKDKTKKISFGIEYVMFQAWSPDGKKIVYMVYDDSNAPLPLHDSQCDGTGVSSSIWIMNSDGTEKTRLTTDEDGYCSDPSFSSDGSRIVYNKGFINPGVPFLVKESTNEIWVMNSDGSNKHMIYTTGDSLYFLHQRAWSKNNEIIFERIQWQKPPEIWVMNSDGTNPMPIVKPKGGPGSFLYADTAWDNTGTKIVTTQWKSAIHEGEETPEIFVDRNVVTFSWEG
jgi:Tol biopolymer transport system component